MSCYPLSYTVYEAPTIEPVSLVEMKAHLRVTFSEDDTQIGYLINAAHKYVEQYLGRALITQSILAKADGWPVQARSSGFEIVLPRPPLQTITSITYVDVNGTTQTLSTSLYTTDIVSEPGRIVSTYNATWPTTRSIANAVSIIYVCGYGSTYTSVPEPIRQAIKMLVADWFRNRETNVLGTIVDELPMGVMALLNPYRMFT